MAKLFPVGKNHTHLYINDSQSCEVNVSINNCNELTCGLNKIIIKSKAVFFWQFDKKFITYNF